MGVHGRQLVLSALAKALRPVVRVLVRNQIDCLSTIEMIKSLYVDVATEGYGISRRPTSISRVAAITNLQRKEVSKIRRRLKDGQLSDKVRPLAAEFILDAWHRYPEFLNEDGKPRPLRYRGEGNTFAALVRCLGRDIPEGAMRTEMLRLGVIEVLTDGRIRPLRDALDTVDDPDTICTALEEGLYPAAECISHNILHSASSDQWPYCVVEAYTPINMDPAITRETSRVEMDRFCSSVNAAFDGNGRAENNQGERTVLLGVYHYEKPIADGIASKSKCWGTKIL